VIQALSSYAMQSTMVSMLICDEVDKKKSHVLSLRRKFALLKSWWIGTSYDTIFRWELFELNISRPYWFNFFRGICKNWNHVNRNLHCRLQNGLRVNFLDRWQSYMDKLEAYAIQLITIEEATNLGATSCMTMENGMSWNWDMFFRNKYVIIFSHGVCHIQTMVTIVLFGSLQMMEGMNSS